MSSKLLWTFLFVVLGAFSLWYSFQATREFLAYRRLSGEAQAKIHHMQTVSSGRYAYVLWAHYTFEEGGETYSGEGALQGESFRNQWVSEERRLALEGKNVPVWFDPAQPSFSRLTRAFPYRLVVYAFSMLGLFIYFFCLRLYLKSH